MKASQLVLCFLAAVLVIGTNAATTTTARLTTVPRTPCYPIIRNCMFSFNMLYRTQKYTAACKEIASARSCLEAVTCDTQGIVMDMRLMMSTMEVQCHSGVLAASVAQTTTAGTTAKTTTVAGTTTKTTPAAGTTAQTTKTAGAMTQTTTPAGTTAQTTTAAAAGLCTLAAAKQCTDIAYGQADPRFYKIHFGGSSDSDSSDSSDSDSSDSSDSDSHSHEISRHRCSKANVKAARKCLLSLRVHCPATQQLIQMLMNSMTQIDINCRRF